MKTYRFTLRPNLRLAAHGLTEPRLNPGDLVGQLAGSSIHLLRDAPWGQEAELTLRADDDSEALDQIDCVLQQLGFSMFEVTIREWSTEILERAILGVGGGAVAGGVFENVLVGIVCSIGGAAIGAWSGAEARRLVAEYDARRGPGGTWMFREVQQPASEQLQAAVLHGLA